MKTISMLFLFVSMSWGQDYIPKNLFVGQEWFNSSYIVDSIVYRGRDGGDTLGHEIISKHGFAFGYEDHTWVYDNLFGNSVSVCAVMHGIEGCPDAWFRGYRICSECLRKEYVREARTPHRVLTEYERLDEQVRKRVK